MTTSTDPRRELTVFNFEGAYGTDDVYSYLTQQGLLVDGAGCNGTCNTSFVGLATELPQLIADVYDDGAVVDGFVNLTASMAQAISESLESLGFDTSPGSPYNVAPCGVYLSDVADAEVDPDEGLCLHDNSTNSTCGCTTPAGLCVMMTNLSVVSSPTSFLFPQVNESLEICETVNRTWDDDSIDVSFIVVSSWFITPDENRIINQAVQAALEASLCEAAGSSFMRENIVDIGSILSDWDAILHPNISLRSFVLGFNNGSAVCPDTDGDGICDCSDDCDDNSGTCCTDSDGDGICDVDDSCPHGQDADGDGVCACNDHVLEDCDCDDNDIFTKFDCANTTTTTNSSIDAGIVNPGDCLDGNCDTDYTTIIVASILTAAGLIIAAAAVYFRSRAMVQSSLQVYQKEVFYEALNRNRQTTVHLLDSGGDNAGYNVDPDLGV